MGSTPVFGLFGSFFLAASFFFVCFVFVCFFLVVVFGCFFGCFGCFGFGWRFLIPAPVTPPAGLAGLLTGACLDAARARLLSL
ncbi:hypothetical protein M011DRAFT_471209 [Sporormia fimetaria CBS 119925]|uniref:Uncharacterized protein n=1 Tax=Sporormia fimetaria CBS 119925 TaxID=1340428 RepID=A0A6A6V2Y9_9PLEO|nr:hypothetical protein M011DRAFT_471209 [Sporormia fimetaria CBS 119925]